MMFVLRLTKIYHEMFVLQKDEERKICMEEEVVRARE